MSWIEISTRSQIQDNATLHTDPGFPLTIGRDCVIGHNVVLHGCTIGDGSLIGMGAIVLNGAKIGANCLVGAGALLTEGKAFPDNSMILGAPAKAVRGDRRADARHDRAGRGRLCQALEALCRRAEASRMSSSAQVAILHRSRRHVHRHRGAGARRQAAHPQAAVGES